VKVAPLCDKPTLALKLASMMTMNPGVLEAELIAHASAATEENWPVLGTVTVLPAETVSGWSPVSITGSDALLSAQTDETHIADICRLDLRLVDDYEHYYARIDLTKKLIGDYAIGHGTWTCVTWVLKPCNTASFTRISCAVTVSRRYSVLP
jgi:hypothetical protein